MTTHCSSGLLAGSRSRWTRSQTGNLVEELQAGELSSLWFCNFGARVGGLAASRAKARASAGGSPIAFVDTISPAESVRRPWR